MAEYIDREAVLEICETEYQERLRMLDYCGDTVAWNIGHAIKAMPAANVAPVVHGRWEWFDEETGTPLTGHEREWGWRCSHCKHELPDDYDDPDYRPMLDYCFNCGAKMDGDGNADH